MKLCLSWLVQLKNRVDQVTDIKAILLIFESHPQNKGGSLNCETCKTEASVHFEMCCVTWGLKRTQRKKSICS